MDLYSPSEILCGRVDECFVKFSCNFPVLTVSLCEMFHVFGDSVDKSECLVPRIKVMQSVFMHTELHVMFAFYFKVDNEMFLSLLYLTRY